MGVTKHSDDLVQKHKGNAKTMLELGSQNTYFAPVYGGNAKEYYSKQGFEHTSIDTNGEYGSLVKDLSQDLELKAEFDLVTDFGTSEHVPNFYKCWVNKHNACKVGGLIISENPKVGNWPGHGYHYVTEAFYKALAEAAGYEVLGIGEHAAMGNVTDGWNVYCVLRKTKENFIPYSVFKGLGYESSIELAPDGTEFIPFEGSEAEAKVKAYKERMASMERAPSDEEQVEPAKPKRGRPPKNK